MDKKTWIGAAALVVATISLLFGPNLYYQLFDCSIFDTLRQACPTPSDSADSSEDHQINDIASPLENVLGTLANWRPGVPECGQVLTQDKLLAIYDTIPGFQGYVTGITVSSVNAERGWQETTVGLDPEDILLISYVAGIWGFAQDENNCGIGNTWWEDRDLSGGEPAQQGSLMGRLGNTPSFFVGNHFAKVANVSGVLGFRMNDDLLSDNHGSLTLLVIRYGFGA